MSLRVLCVTEGADLPTTHLFIGMQRAGLGVTVVMPAAHPAYATLAGAGIPLIDFRFRKNFERRAIDVLRSELVCGSYDVLYLFNNKGVTNGLRASRGLPVRVVCYRGIVGAVSFLDPMSWMRYLNPRIDRIVCVCRAIREHFLGMSPGFLRMPPERPVVIYKGHRLEWYTAEPSDLTAIGIPENAFVIGCTANYRPRKGIEYLVDAMALLPEDIPAHLLLVGHMSARRLDRHIAASPARDRIHRPGFRTDAPALSAACDVFCLPSTKREGLPRAVIEAMVYRVPPVVTASGGSPELVVDGESGLVVPVKDAAALAAAFETLYRDEARRRRMGKAARERIARDFRHEDTVRETVALLESLVTQPG